ncbi:MAG: FAD-dependent oxidoreductase [Sulfitobacter sp.]
MDDITVRGAGILGLSIAWICAQRGARVQVIDPMGAASGSSGGIVGALAPHVPENWNPKKAFQFDSLLMAKDFWTQVDAEGGGDAGYARGGRVQPIANARGLELARARAETAKSLWQSQAQWDVTQNADPDWHSDSPTGWFVRDTLTARIHPRRACDAIVKALRAKGISVVPDGPDCGQVLWATGTAGLHDLSRTFDRPVGSGVKGQAALLEFAAPCATQLFVDGVHIVPHNDGTVAIGSTSEPTFDDPISTDAQLDFVIEKARVAVPALRGAPVVARWAGVRPRAKSRAPMLGAWPERPAHFIANGGFKIGFGMAPKIAHVMADLMLEGTDTIPDGFTIAASL